MILLISMKCLKLNRLLVTLAMMRRRCLMRLLLSKPKLGRLSCRIVVSRWIGIILTLSRRSRLRLMILVINPLRCIRMVLLRLVLIWIKLKLCLVIMCWRIAGIRLLRKKILVSLSSVVLFRLICCWRLRCRFRNIRVLIWIVKNWWTMKRSKCRRRRPGCMRCILTFWNIRLTLLMAILVLWLATLVALFKWLTVLKRWKMARRLIRARLKKVCWLGLIRLWPLKVWRICKMFIFLLIIRRNCRRPCWLVTPLAIWIWIRMLLSRLTWWLVIILIRIWLSWWRVCLIFRNCRCATLNVYVCECGLKLNLVFDYLFSY